MRRKGKWSVGEYLALNDRSTGLIGSVPQPLTRRNQTSGVVVLFSNTGGALHDAQGERRHSIVEAGQLGQELAVFSDHSVSPESPHRASAVQPKAAASAHRRGMASDAVRYALGPSRQPLRNSPPSRMPAMSTVGGTAVHGRMLSSMPMLPLALVVTLTRVAVSRPARPSSCCTCS
jgi:hypothetical protein